MKSLKLIDDTNNSEEFVKERHVVNYLKSMAALEEAMEPYKEQKKELRQEYIENGWLSKDELWAAVKAFRLYIQGKDLIEINDMFEAIERQFGVRNEL